VPAKDVFTANSKLSSATEYLLVDFSGKTVACGKLEPGANTINCSNLNNGIYFLQFKYKGKNVVKTVMISK
jgi:hypothetical protein